MALTSACGGSCSSLRPTASNCALSLPLGNSGSHDCGMCWYKSRRCAARCPFISTSPSLASAELGPRLSTAAERDEVSRCWFRVGIQGVLDGPWNAGELMSAAPKVALRREPVISSVLERSPDCSTTLLGLASVLCLLYPLASPTCRLLPYYWRGCASAQEGDVSARYLSSELGDEPLTQSPSPRNAGNSAAQAEAGTAPSSACRNRMKGACA